MAFDDNYDDDDDLTEFNVPGETEDDMAGLELLDTRTFVVTVERTKGIESSYYEKVTVQGVSYAVEADVVKFYQLTERMVGEEPKMTLVAHRCLRNWVDVADVTDEYRGPSKAIN
jgi:hypothetical protein